MFKQSDIKMSVKSKMDTLDFMINVLIEHEKKLDIIIERFENHAENIEILIKKERLNNYYQLRTRGKTQ